MAGIFTWISPLRSSLDYHLERHSVLSSNVAHVDTPGYKPSDLERIDDFASAMNSAMGVQLERTNHAHMSAGENSRPVQGRVFEDLSGGTGNDGNYVSLDREAAKIAANQLRYDVVSAIVSAEIRQLHFAANDAKG